MSVFMKKTLIFVLLLITGLGCSAFFFPLPWVTTRVGLNFSSLVELMAPVSLSKSTSYAAIIWLFGSAIMGLLALLFGKLGLRT